MAKDVVNDDAKGIFRRVELLTGPARRRRWSAAEKARIVAETLQVGTSVTEVARRWQVCPQQVWGWRREARDGHLALPAAVGGVAEPGFVPIIAEPAAAVNAAEPEEPVPTRTVKSGAAPSIEIKLAGAVVRVAIGTDGALLTAVLRAVRASAA